MVCQSRVVRAMRPLDFEMPLPAVRDRQRPSIVASSGSGAAHFFIFLESREGDRNRQFQVRFGFRGFNEETGQVSFSPPGGRTKRRGVCNWS